MGHDLLQLQPNTQSTDVSEQDDCILVVDDSQDNLSFIQVVLEDEGYDVVLAENGVDGLTQVETCLPDLVLSDVMMPKMNGIELTQAIRQRQDLPFIPILLITAQAQSDVVEGLDAGADDFIRKPMDVDELLARVRSLLRLKHSIDRQTHMMRQQEDFVSRLTHDLRTPLVAAERMLELFQQGAFGDLSDTGAEAIRMMDRSNENLLALVNTMLEVYRYDAGYKTLNFSLLDFQALVQTVIQDLTPLAEQKHLTIQAALPPSQINGVRLELHRVLTNLLGNALKFTDRGKITVCLTPDDIGVTLTIEDTGVGIADDEIPFLFSRFRQGSHTHQGSGLGLYLSQQIVQVHGGTISVSSTVNEGSTFTVWLPTNLP